MTRLKTPPPANSSPKLHRQIFGQYTPNSILLLLLSVVLFLPDESLSDSGLTAENKAIDNSIGWNQANIEVNGIDRVFRYFLPKEFQENMPVVILLHGGTQSMTRLLTRKTDGRRLSS